MTPIPNTIRLNRFFALARTSLVVCSSTIMKQMKKKQPNTIPCSARAAKSTRARGR